MSCGCNNPRTLSNFINPVMGQVSSSAAISPVVLASRVLTSTPAPVPASSAPLPSVYSNNGSGGSGGSTTGQVPNGTTLIMPSIVGAATSTLPPNGSGPGSTGLTPVDLLHPLPSIVNTQPVQAPVQCANPVNQWVNDNPLLAVGVLLGAAYLLLGKDFGMGN